MEPAAPAPAPVRSATGIRQTLVLPRFETRQVVLAAGADFHDSDLAAGYPDLQKFTWLRTRHPTLEEAGPDEAAFTSDAQRVRYEMRQVYTKHEFREALQTEGVLAIYCGHARYGRGPCFAQYADTVPTAGDHWESGAERNDPLDRQDDGLFRMAYPYIPIPLSDIEAHRYTFAPLPAEAARPPQRDLHPDGRGRTLLRQALPADLDPLVHPDYRSPSGRYYGVSRRSHGPAQFHPFLHAGWSSTQNAPYDLDATDLRCRCFCHFGCSTKLHAWKVVRDARYKGWRRPSPPDDRYAYFTDHVASPHAWLYWLQHLLAYDQPNAYQSWWDALEYAKREANRSLRSDAQLREWGMRYQIY